MLVLLLSQGCSRATSSHTFPRLDDETAPLLGWPAAPDTTRIRYLGSLARPSDVGARKSIWRRVAELVVGATEREVRQPYGIAVDTMGRVYVADVAVHGVHVFDWLAGRYRFIEGAGRTSFKTPIGVATDGAGNLYVADSELETVFALDSDGRERWRAEGMSRPTGLAYDRLRGLLWVVETTGHRVTSLDTAGRRVSSLGRRGTESGELNFPTSVVTGPDGTVYVSDALNFRVQLFDSTGSPRSNFGHHGDAVGNLARPKGIALDTDGHIYVVEGLFDVVNIYEASGGLLLSFGGAGNGRGEFWLATGLAIDTRNRVFVADSFNRRVQVFQYLPAGR